MPLAYWCILIAGILPLISVAIAKAKPRYNNHNPRDWLDKQEGFRRRADFAHRNHFEAFPFFAAGVLVAQQLQVSQSSIDGLAIGFVVARIAYTALYIADQATLRSLAWVAGYGCVVTLFIRAAHLG